MSIKNAVFRIIRKTYFQPLWEKLAHLSNIGQNFWSSVVHETGELYALDFARSRLANRSPYVVVDVGANIGQFALAAVAHLQPTRIYSFEPSSAAFRRLSEEAQRQPLLDVVEPHSYALSDVSGEAVLYTSDPGATIASLHDLRRPPEGFKPECSETVSTRTLDDFCAENGIVEIGYLKIDVEGHELNVLKGAHRMLKERRIRFVQFEFGEANIDSRTFMRDFFEVLGGDFDFYRIVSNGLRQIPAYHPGLEVFGTINYLASRRVH